MKKLFLSLILAICSLNVFAQTTYDLVPERKAMTFESSSLDGVQWRLRSASENPLYFINEHVFLNLNSKVALVFNYSHQRTFGSATKFHANIYELGFSTFRKRSSFFEVVSGLTAGAGWQKKDGVSTCKFTATFFGEDRVYVSKDRYLILGASISAFGKTFSGGLSVGFGARL